MENKYGAAMLQRKIATMDETENIKPQLVHRRSGGWLAYSIRSSPLQIGVTALSQEDATHRFQTAVDGWTRNLASESSSASY
jgi:hypothetical protein